MERDPSENQPENTEEKQDEGREHPAVEAREAAADLAVAEEFRNALEAQEERLKKDPTFSAQGRKYGIVNDVDYLVAKAQVKEQIAEEILMGAVERGDYWQEKAAAKLAAFERQSEDVFALYAEAKLYHPDMAKILEEEHPYLKDVYEEAKSSFQARKMES